MSSIYGEVIYYTSHQEHATKHRGQGRLRARLVVETAAVKRNTRESIHGIE